MATNMVLPPSLVSSLQGLWTMEGNGNDSSPNAYNLTNGNSVTFTNGLFGKTAHFVSANNQSLSITNAASPNINMTGSQTWTLWAYPTDVTVSDYLMSKVGAVEYGFAGSNPGIMRFKLQGLTTNDFVNSPNNSMIANQWNHVMGIYDSAASKIKIWINGVKTELTASGSASANTADFYIGKYSGSNAFNFPGDIDECAIFSRALSDTEATDYYNKYKSYYAYRVGRRTAVL